MKKRDFLFFTLVSIATVFSQFAQADFYYHSYYQQPRSLPIISLTLDPQEGLNSDLRIAAREGKPKLVEKLIAGGAHVNGVSEEGKTALMYAARDCSIDSGRVLLKHHAAVNLQDHEGKTALIYAAMAACSPLISLLTHEPEIELRLRDKEGFSALDYAEDGASLYMVGRPVSSLHLIEQALVKNKGLRLTHVN